MTTRPPILRLSMDELVVDNFAGGGGASTGLARAIGRDPDYAINHDVEALAMHEANHPGTKHLCENVWDIDPVKVCAGRPVGVAWFSPDCTFHSKARGGKPFRDRDRARRRRGLAWVVVRWAKAVKPRIILLENVEEFADWGPLGEDGNPDPARRGLTFRRWVSSLRNTGYAVEWRELRASDYGAPTSRKRLFVVARCDGQPIVWPAPTHGPGRARPYRTAAECIDWSIPCPSIFDRKKPLADATLRRIARGIKRYVLDAERPFLVPVTHQGGERVYSVDEPMRTVTCANRGEQALVTPVMVRTDMHKSNAGCAYHAEDPLRTVTTGGGHAVVAPLLSPVKTWGGGGNEAAPADRPMRTITASKRGEHAIVVPTLIQTGYGEREGQAPRTLDIHKPLGTVVAEGTKHALVSAFLAQHYGGGPNGVQPPGRQMTLPMGTVTARDHHAVVASSLVKLKGTCRDGQPVSEPLGTVQAQGNHYAEVRAFLLAYYGTDQDGQLGLPLATVTTRDRFALVTIAGVDYAVVDIGMRMLKPRELFNAQSFPPDYQIAPVLNGKPLTLTAQVRMAGNSVCPDLAEALVRAQLEDSAMEAVA